MKIAQLAGWYSPTSGGIRTVVDRLGTGYRAAGHSATLIVPGPRDGETPERITLAAPPLPGGGGYRWLLQRSRLAATLSEIDPDVVEVHDKFWLGPVAGWARDRGRPIVVLSHERLDVTLPMLLPIPQMLTELVSDHYRSLVQRSAAAIVTCSGFAAAEFPTSTRLPLGVDSTLFRPAVAPVVPGGRADVELLLVSRLSREKRPDRAVAAVEALVARGVDVRLTVLGGGPLDRSLRRQALGLPVHFRGFIAGREAVAAAMAAADLALAPGPAETFGLSALEALACGVPVVATAGSAVAELIGGDSGRAVGAHGVAFADGVQDLLRVPVGRRRRAARAVAVSHPWERTVETALVLLTEVVAASGRPVTVPGWKGTAATSTPTAAPSPGTATAGRS